MTISIVVFGLIGVPLVLLGGPLMHANQSAYRHRGEPGHETLGDVRRRIVYWQATVVAWMAVMILQCVLDGLWFAVPGLLVGVVIVTGAMVWAIRHPAP